MLEDLGQILYNKNRVHVKKATYVDGSFSLFFHSEDGTAAFEATKFHPATKDLQEQTGYPIVALRSQKVFNLLKKNNIIKRKAATINGLILATLQTK